MQLKLQQELIARFSRHLEAGTTDMADGNLRVPAAHYIDPAQTRQEIDALFRGGPLLVALTPDLPTAGDFVTHEAVGTSLLLVRDDTMQVRAYLNACRHRGARIAEGRGHKKTFSCPFHAWNWGRDGNLIARPNSSGGFDNLGEVCSKLIEVSACEVAGMIFVLLDDGLFEGHDLHGKEGIQQQVEKLLGGALDDIRGYNIADTGYFGERTAQRDCNYKFIIDGFCESYHIAALHKESISPFYYTTPSLTDLLGDTSRMIGVRRSIDKEFDKPINEQQLLPHGTTQYLIPPNIVLTHQVDHIQFWRVYPIDGRADRCRIQFSLYWPRPITEETQRKSQFNIDVIWKVITTEDIPQSLAIHRNLASGALPELFFGRNEPALINYHTHISSAIGSNKLTHITD